jgi:hypothetical protein
MVLRVTILQRLQRLHTPSQPQALLLPSANGKWSSYHIVSILSETYQLHDSFVKKLPHLRPGYASQESESWTEFPKGCHGSPYLQLKQGSKAEMNSNTRLENCPSSSLNPRCLVRVTAPKKPSDAQVSPPGRRGRGSHHA